MIFYHLLQDFDSVTHFHLLCSHCVILVVLVISKLIATVIEEKQSVDLVEIGPLMLHVWQENLIWIAIDLVKETLRPCWVLY